MNTYDVRCPICNGKLYYNSKKKAFVCKRCAG